MGPGLGRHVLPRLHPLQRECHARSRRLLPLVPRFLDCSATIERVVRDLTQDRVEGVDIASGRRISSPARRVGRVGGTTSRGGALHR